MNQPQSLSELVELAIRHRDTSGLGLSHLAAKNGHQLTATTINQIRQGLYKSKPREATIRAIAWLADVNDEVAFTAAGQPVPGPPFAEELPPGVDSLSLKSRKAAIDMLRVLVDLEKDADATTHHRTADYTLTPSQDAEVVPGAIQPAHRIDARLGQKTTGRLSAVPNVQRGSTLDDVGNIPLPDDYLSLAAHPATDSPGRREHKAGRERGEESQDD